MLVSRSCLKRFFESSVSVCYFAVVACGTSGAGAGGAGTGGATTGGGGATGTSLCPAAPDTIEGCLRAADGALLRSSLSAAITVLSREQVPAGACADPVFDRSTAMNDSGPTWRFVLEAVDGRRWTLYARIPGMAADRVPLGDTFDLALDASANMAAFYTTLNQTVTLGNAGQLTLFVSTLNNPALALPNLGLYGIDVTEGEAACEDPRGISGCGKRGYRTQVSARGQNATIERGGTTRIGDLSFSVEASDDVVDYGGCDTKGFVQMAGVADGTEGATVVSLRR
jgi:hypothetical protein